MGQHHYVLANIIDQVILEWKEITKLFWNKICALTSFCLGSSSELCLWLHLTFWFKGSAKRPLSCRMEAMLPSTNWPPRSHPLPYHIGALIIPFFPFHTSCWGQIWRDCGGGAIGGTMAIIDGHPYRHMIGETCSSLRRHPRCCSSSAHSTVCSLLNRCLVQTMQCICSLYIVTWCNFVLRCSVWYRGNADSM